MERLILAKPINYQILPSILSADITQLGLEVSSVIEAGADMIHIDVMDNHYVPNLTFGPLLCEAIHNRYPNISMDVHLMVSPVDSLIKQFAKAGAKRISIHKDSTSHLDRSLQLIQDVGCKAGLALNPSDSPDEVKWCIHRLDFVLVMTVNPGFGGQKLISEVIPKISYLNQQYKELSIGVDGGVTADNIKLLATAGANEFVAGSAIFRSENYKKTIDTMRNNLS